MSDIWVGHGSKERGAPWNWKTVESEEEAKRMVKGYKKRGQGGKLVEVPFVEEMGSVEA